MLAGSAAVLAAVLAGGIAVGLSAGQLQHTQHRQSQLTGAAPAQAGMFSGFIDEETGLRGYLLTGQPAFLAPYFQAQASLPAIMDIFRTDFLASGGPAPLPHNCSKHMRRG